VTAVDRLMRTRGPQANKSNESYGIREYLACRIPHELGLAWLVTMIARESRMQPHVTTRSWALILCVGLGVIAVLGYLGYRTHTEVESYVETGSLFFKGIGEPWDFSAVAPDLCALPMAKWKLRTIMADSTRSSSEAMSAAMYLGAGTGAYVDVLEELAVVRKSRARYFAYEELIRLGHVEFVEPMLAGLDGSDPWGRDGVAHWASQNAEHLPLEPTLEVLRRHTDEGDALFREAVSLAIQKLESRLPGTRSD